MKKHIFSLLIVLLSITPLAAQDTLLYWQEGQTRRIMLPLAADDNNPADDSLKFALTASPALFRQIDSAYTANGNEPYQLPYLILVTNGSVTNGTYKITALKAIEQISPENAVAYYDYWANGYEPGWDLLVSRRMGKILFRNYAAEVESGGIVVFPYNDPIEPTMRQSVWYTSNGRGGGQLHAVFTQEVCSVAISGYKVRCEVFLSNLGAYSGCAATPQQLPVDNE